VFQHFLLPTDGSELSRTVTANGVRLVNSFHAKITGIGVGVTSKVAGGRGEVTRGADEFVHAAEQYVGVIANEARRHGVAHACFYVKGASVHGEIIETAIAKDGDSIFAASRGHRGFAGLLLGSQVIGRPGPRQGTRTRLPLRR
jgi:nucleotide-binding universal stress UspA family protein